MVNVLRMADFHQEVLGKHCRICGKALARFKIRYSCADKRYRGAGVNLWNSCEWRQCRCTPCVFLPRLLQHRPSVEQFLWTPHNAICTICDHFHKAASGGRPRKIGGPSASSTRSTIKHLHTIAPEAYFSRVESTSSSVSISDLVCPMCSLIVDRPIQLTTCNRLVCLKCLCSTLSKSGFSCPSCRVDHLEDQSTMVCPSPVVKIIGDLLVPCVKCNKQVATGI